MTPAEFDALMSGASPELREMMAGLLAISAVAAGEKNELALRAVANAFQALAQQSVEAKRLGDSALRLLKWAPYVTAGIKYRGQQRLRASQAGKLTAAQKRRAIEQYGERVRNGQQYGALKALAVAFDVSTKTMSTIVAGKKNRK